MYGKIYSWFEPYWEKHSTYISLLVAVAITVLFILGFITNIRNVTENIINFASIIIGVNGVFLTLIITLQESAAFIRLKEFFPNFQIRLYISLRDQIGNGLTVVLISIAINLMPPSPSIYLSGIGVLVWFYFFVKMFIGSFVSVKLVTDIIVKNFDMPSKKPRI